MKKPLVCAAFVVGLGLGFPRAQGPAGGQTPTDRAFSIVTLDPGLSAIIDPGANAELLGDRFGLNEGPVWVQEGPRGYLLFSDMLDNVIYKWEQNRPTSVFLENAGYTGKDVNNVGQQTRRGRSAAILIGPNGLSLDPQGRLIICAMPDRTVVRLEKDGTRTVLADKFEGKKFNGPNDVVVKSNGALYFTDSISGLRGANAKVVIQELLTQDHVDILAGWIYSPNAIASAPIVSAGKRLAVIMNAGTAHITTLSPYYVRVSFSMWHAGYAMGEAAAKILKAKTAVVGYSPFWARRFSGSA